jgi:hypothetical protein
MHLAALVAHQLLLLLCQLLNLQELQPNSPQLLLVYCLLLLLLLLLPDSL